MSRYVPPLLLEHLQQDATTVCLLIRVRPVDPEFDELCMTDLDRTVSYDDGDGPKAYLSSMGYHGGTAVSNRDQETDNSELSALASSPEFDLPLTEEHVDRGAYDNAEYDVYLINYDDVSMGHIHIDAGTLGEMRMHEGAIVLGEMRSLGDQLRQSFIQRDSRLCRERLGSPKCGVNLTPLWKECTVTVVDADEPDKLFTIAGAEVLLTDGVYRNGIIKFTSGANIGRSYEIDYNESDGDIRLRFATRYAVANGDTADIRIGCMKRFLEDCIGVHNNGPNFRGEPHQPTGDANALMVPGANVGNSSSAPLPTVGDTEEA